MNEVKELVNMIIDAINNPSPFDWLQLVVSIIIGGITFWVALLTFKLQRKMKEDDDREKTIKMNCHIGNVYYFLNDIINKMADIRFEYGAFNNITVEGRQFMEDINYLRARNITDQEFCLLKELYALYDGIKMDPRLNQKNFKILYKKVIDVNVNPKDIPIYRNENNYDYVISFPLLVLMKKMEYSLNNKIKATDNRITININDNDNSFVIKKSYGKGYHLDNSNGIISGKVKRYEAILHFEKQEITLTSELIYDGTIKDNKISGNGKYYYYTSTNGFGAGLDSCGLNQEGVNLDIIAQKIKNILVNENPTGHFNATFDGIFKNNTISCGLLKYKMNSTDEEKELAINN